MGKAMIILKQIIKKVINTLGYDIIKNKKEKINNNIVCNHNEQIYKDKISDILLKINNTFLSIVSPKTELYYLFHLQQRIDELINIKCKEHYKGKHPKHHLWTIHYQFIIQNINKNDKVLDVGSGASLSYTQKLAKVASEIDCCDIKPELVEYSMNVNKYNNVNYFVLDITKEIPEKKYDVIILSHVLEHLDNPKKVLENIKKITKKVIIRLPRYDDHWMYLVKKDLGFYYFKDADHKKEYTLIEAVDLVESAGWIVDIALNDIDIKIVAKI